MNFHPLHLLPLTQPKEQTPIVLRLKAVSPLHLPHLLQIAAHHPHPSPNRISIALRTHQLQTQPMVSIAPVVAQ